MIKNHQLTGKKRLEFLEKVSTELLSSFHQQKTLQKIAELTVPALADYCRIVLVDEHNNVKHTFAHHIDPEKLELLKQLYEHYKDRPEITHGITKILQTGKPDIIPSFAEYSQRNIHLHDQNPQLVKIANALHITSYIGVPLIVRRKVIGAMALSSTTEDRLFTQNDLLFVQKVAKRIALAIYNAYLYKKAQDEILERKNKEIQLIEESKKNWSLLADTSKILSGSLDYNETLSKLARLTVPAWAEWCIVDLLNKKDIYQRIQVAYADPANKDIADTLYKHPPSNDIMALKPTGIMVVPLIARGKTLGTITFLSTNANRKYTNENLTVAERIADHAALAVDNAWLYKKAQEAIGIRDDFISIASHELKTPITTLKLYTQILEKITKENGDKKSFSHLKKMAKQINKLTILSSDLLDASKLTHKKMKFTMSTFSLDDEIKDAIYAIQTLTTKHKIILEGKIGRKIEGDKHRIYQVVTNLLTNAIKYSPDSHTIKMKLRTTAENAIVTVQDSGIGIDEKHLNKLFLQFYRVNTPEEKTFPGLGIGLYIANEIITKHGGKLTVSSERGVGSEFTFTLPFHQKF